MSLHGKLAVVTGASSGICRAVAERFRDEGMRVIGVDLNERDLKSIDGIEHLSVDLSNDEGRAKVVVPTSLLIVPGYSMRICSGLITNFHQPKSTLLLLVSALLGGDWKRVYHYAMQNDFRFLSYGDSSLLLP